MSTLKKIGNYFGFGEEEYEQDDSYGAREEEPEYGFVNEEEVVDEPEQPLQAAVTPIRASVRPVESTPPAGLQRIQTIHPRSYNDAKAIGQSFREGIPVIINLSAMDEANAKRLVDFSAGLIFGLRGSIEKVTGNVFLLTPENIEVSTQTAAPDQAQAEFFNQS